MRNLQPTSSGQGGAHHMPRYLRADRHVRSPRVPRRGLSPRVARAEHLHRVASAHGGTSASAVSSAGRPRLVQVLRSSSEGRSWLPKLPERSPPYPI